MKLKMLTYLEVGLGICAYFARLLPITVLIAVAGGSCAFVA